MGGRAGTRVEDLHSGTAPIGMLRSLLVLGALIFAAVKLPVVHDSHAAVEIIAHRGASRDAPENTVASLKLGWEQKADADELDTRLTQDGRAVVIHDANTRRTTGVALGVAASTLAELRALDAGAWKGSQWTGEKLPTLAEAVETIPDGKRLFVDIKCRSEALPELEHVLTSSGKTPSQFAIIGFDYATMQRAKKQFPGLEVYWLASTATEINGAMPTVEALVERATAAGFDGLDLEYTFPIDHRFASKIKAAGLKFYVWTVDDDFVARKLVAAGVDGITTNRPEWLRQHLK
jgi:glycerophosphoryl diester phosphodiesterase